MKQTQVGIKIASEFQTTLCKSIGQKQIDVSESWKQNCTALFNCSSKVQPLSKIPANNGQQESTQHSADLHQGLIISPASHYFHRQTLYWVDDSTAMVAKVHSKVLSIHDLRSGDTHVGVGPIMALS